MFEQVLPEGPLYLINETFLKLYVEYAKKDKNGNTTADGHVRYGFDASAADLGKKWLSQGQRHRHGRGPGAADRG